MCCVSKTVQIQVLVFKKEVIAVAVNSLIPVTEPSG